MEPRTPEPDPHPAENSADPHDQVPVSEAATGAPSEPAESYWRLDASVAADQSKGARFVDALLTLGVIVALYVLSVVGVAVEPYTEAERVGVQLAIVGMGLAIGFAARWLYLRNRDSGRPITRLFAPWALFGAFVVMLPTLGGVANRTPADPSAALRISSAYTLTELEPAALSQVEGEYRQGLERGLGGMAIRQVDGADGSISVLLVIDGTFGPDADLTAVAQAMGDRAGGAPRLDRIGTQPVAISTTAAQSIVSWIESPFLIMVAGADEPTARDVAAAVLVTPRD